MFIPPSDHKFQGRFFFSLIFLILFLHACTIPRKYQKDTPFITKNNIEVKGGKFTKDERSSLKQRLNAQLDDSSRVTTKDALFIIHYINRPPAYDTASSGRSARNMEASMLHIGYYKSVVTYKADTVRSGEQHRVHVHYTLEAGKPTLIDTVRYILRRPDLQELAMKNMNKTLLKKGVPVTKSAVLGEISRLVELYRNNGYYKFTSEELKMRGDTTAGALTTISDDIFEQIRLLAEAQAARDSPTIKLALVLNQPSDTSKLRKYYIGNIYILPDYQPGDKLNDPSLLERGPASKSFIVRYHRRMFRTGFLSRHLFMRRGDLYNQENFYKTLTSFSNAGVWQSTNIQVIERKDSTDRIDLVIQLIPGKQFGFEAAIEASYSATSNANNVTAANAGNLLGLSGNVSLLNRNFQKEGIRMTNAIRAGIELNLKPDSGKRSNIINSNELSYSNNIVFPRFIFPFKNLNRDRRFIGAESFINTNLSFINRINLFNLQTVNFALGYDWSSKRSLTQTRQWVIKPFNIEFARLFNETDSFKKTLQENPFLRYSFNTALVAGSSIGFKSNSINPRHPNRQHSFKVNVEESGLIWGNLGIMKKYMRKFVKTDVEYVFSSSRPKTAFVFRIFGGVGIASRSDTTLPFFKQYFGGGSNSMRGWPVRGIGRGSQPLTPFGTSKFNDRTGDIQLEANLEYRYVIAQIIPNSLILKGAIFCDMGNIWNLRNSKPGGGTDSTQFQFKNLYKELGIAAGTGFRLDFNYFVLRFDLGFRFKRPEISNINNGWKVPSLGFDDVLQKLFTKGTNDEYKKWRYENFNFTIGISYPF
ncbi:MAG: BamA/TamA family outer membrane protein [Chitinophagaceae bacterium]|nr:BamA/TamA family outer membrane protein [Chitinophagaceae bacterium]